MFLFIEAIDEMFSSIEAKLVKIKFKKFTVANQKSYGNFLTWAIHPHGDKK